ncbi:hypothetical protein [Alkalihalobacillus sp. 1P02AB]|uniref:hypothetical protein n=1 Tax=Alkalihalobacillus sp. 1P02AB TaxID=3132260 RepID=UPI0039A69A86
MTTTTRTQIRYKVVAQVKDSQITTNVFTQREVNKDQLRPLAIANVLNYMEQMEIDGTKDDINLIGFQNLGVFN